MSNTSQFTALNFNNEKKYACRTLICWMRIRPHFMSNQFQVFSKGSQTLDHQFKNITARDYRHGNTIECTSIMWVWRSYPSSRLWRKRTVFHVSFQTLKVRETPRFNIQLKMQAETAGGPWFWLVLQNMTAVQLHLRSLRFIPTSFTSWYMITETKSSCWKFTLFQVAIRCVEI